MLLSCTHCTSKQSSLNVSKSSSRPLISLNMFLPKVHSRLVMQIVTILCFIWIIEAVRCEYCGQDFVSLGRHVWRCKACVTLLARSLPNVVTPHPPMGPSNSAGTLQVPNPLPPVPLIFSFAFYTSIDVHCPRRRFCRSRRGLKAHQRACGFFKRLVQGGLLNPTDNAS